MSDTYNRYIPQPDGSFRRNRVQMDTPLQERRPPAPPPQEKPSPCKEESCRPRPECPRQRHRPPIRHSSPGRDIPAGTFLKNLLPKDMDISDLMIVLLLLLMAGDCPEDRNTSLLTLALYFFM